MKILYIGNTRNLDSFGESFNTEKHIANDLRALGHEVDEFQEPPGGGDSDTLNQIARRAEGCALLLWTRTWGLPEDATKLWRYLEGEGVTTASVHLDLYVGIARQAKVERDPFWTTGWVFTPDGNPEAEAWFAAHGINHVWSSPAVVSDECYCAEPDPRWAGYEVAFVGSAPTKRGGSYHPEHRFRRDLVEWLAARYGDSFIHVGSGGNVDLLRGPDLNRFYATVTIIVGDSCLAHPAQRYWSDRATEATGRGAFLLHPRIAALAERMRDVPSLAYYECGDLGSLEGEIERWAARFRDDPALRPKLTEEGSAWVRGHETYRHRMAALLKTVGLT